MIYGHLAEVMLSQPTTKIFLRTTEPKARRVGIERHRQNRN